MVPVCTVALMERCLGEIDPFELVEVNPGVVFW